MNALSYSESATWGDYDNDGFLDLYVSNSGNNLADNYNFLYKNEAGTLQLQQHHITVKRPISAEVPHGLIMTMMVI